MFPIMQFSFRSLSTKTERISLPHFADLLPLFCSAHCFQDERSPPQKKFFFFFNSELSNLQNANPPHVIKPLLWVCDISKFWVCSKSKNFYIKNSLKSAVSSYHKTSHVFTGLPQDICEHFAKWEMQASCVCLWGLTQTSNKSERISRLRHKDTKL